jgi:GntR family transcriptional regulator/MocR family aminotransferase
VTAGSDFLQLDPRPVPRGERATWLADQLRRAALDGALPVGARLPSTRVLADELGFARGTISDAYARLAEEGLLSTNRGGGTTVAARPAAPHEGRRAGSTSAPTSTTTPAEPTMIDLVSGVPDLSAFPRGAWLRAERRVLDTANARQLGYAPPQGVPELRAELAVWLARSRGVQAAPEQIVITGGVTGALSLLYQVLAGRGSTGFALEDPGSQGNRRILDHWAGGLTPVPVDQDGIVVSALRSTRADVVVVTPAHHYPTGVALSAERRRELIDWAVERDGLIIEDDYDAEYRYDRAPIKAVQPLAPDRIAYTASLSKTLAPGLRLGWLVAPDRLLDKIIEKRWATDLGSPALPQLVLAELLRDGTLARHLRSMRIRHRLRRDAAMAAITEHLPDCTVGGIAAGIYLLISLPERCDDQLVAERARSAAVLVEPLSRHRSTPGPPGMIITYANQSPERIRTAIGRLADAIEKSPV